MTMKQLAISSTFEALRRDGNDVATAFGKIIFLGTPYEEIEKALPSGTEIVRDGVRRKIV